MSDPLTHSMDSIAQHNRPPLLIRLLIGMSLLVGMVWLFMEAPDIVLPLLWISLALYIVLAPLTLWQRQQRLSAAPTPAVAAAAADPEREFWKERLEAARQRRMLARIVPPTPEPVVVQPSNLLELQVKLSERLRQQGRELPPEQLQQLAETVLARLQGQAAPLPATKSATTPTAPIAPAPAPPVAAVKAAPATVVNNRYAPFFARCNSRLEKQLLAALIQQGRLVPQGEALHGRIRVRVQAKILKYYFDFLIDDRFALEIIEFDYKTDEFAQIHDRVRNETLAMSGYRRVKVTAARVAADPQEVARRMIALAEQPPTRAAK